MKLPQLQNYIKRDPTSYRDEFLMQKRHFDSELEIFKLRPSNNSDRFTELVTFMSHVVPNYPDDCKVVVEHLLELLELKAITLHPSVRYKLLQALIILRKRDVVDPLVVPTCMVLVACPPRSAPARPILLEVLRDEL